MTRENAINIYLQKHPKSAKSIERMVLWNESFSITQNSRALKMNTGNCCLFKDRYGLKVTREIQKIDHRLDKSKPALI